LGFYHFLFILVPFSHYTARLYCTFSCSGDASMQIHITFLSIATGIKQWINTNRKKSCFNIG